MQYLVTLPSYSTDLMAATQPVSPESGNQQAVSAVCLSAAVQAPAGKLYVSHCAIQKVLHKVAVAHKCFSDFKLVPSVRASRPESTGGEPSAPDRGSPELDHMSAVRHKA